MRPPVSNYAEHPSGNRLVVLEASTTYGPPLAQGQRLNHESDNSTYHLDGMYSHVLREGMPLWVQLGRASCEYPG